MAIPCGSGIAFILYNSTYFVQMLQIVKFCTKRTKCLVWYDFGYLREPGRAGRSKPMVLPSVSRAEGPVFVVRKQAFGVGMEGKTLAVRNIPRAKERGEFS